MKKEEYKLYNLTESRTEQPNNKAVSAIPPRYLNLSLSKTPTFSFSF